MIVTDLLPTGNLPRLYLLLYKFWFCFCLPLLMSVSFPAVEVMMMSPLAWCDGKPAIRSPSHRKLTRMG